MNVRFLAMVISNTMTKAVLGGSRALFLMIAETFGSSVFVAMMGM